LRFLSSDPKEVEPPDFEITGRTEDVFHHSPMKHPVPVPWGEALVVSNAKWRRPVIVVSDATGSEILLPREKPTKTYMCVPVYGCDQHEKEPILRIAHYEYPNLFYLPRSIRPPFDEGFARLDHLQAIQVTNLRERKCRLSDEALDFLDEWLVYFLM
jgi:hypothetical protein